MKLILNRISLDDTQTIGSLKVIGCGKVEEFHTVELAWRDNETNVSCIPDGRYKARRIADHYRFKKCFLLYDVPDRTEIFIHASNYYHQLRGCIAPGRGFKDIDRDGHVDVLQSRIAINKIYDLCPDDVVIEIYSQRFLLTDQ